MGTSVLPPPGCGGRLDSMLHVGSLGKTKSAPGGGGDQSPACVRASRHEQLTEEFFIHVVFSHEPL